MGFKKLSMYEDGTKLESITNKRTKSHVNFDHVRIRVKERNVRIDMDP